MWHNFIYKGKWLEAKAEIDSPTITDIPQRCTDWPDNRKGDTEDLNNTVNKLKSKVAQGTLNSESRTHRLFLVNIWGCHNLITKTEQGKLKKKKKAIGYSKYMYKS